MDNAAQTAPMWRKIIPTDLPGGVLVKQDLYHFKRRFTSAVPKTHPLYIRFCASLSEAMMPVAPGEVERLIATGLDPADQKLIRQRARKVVPAGRTVLDSIAKLLDDYAKLPGGDSFITKAVRDVLAVQENLVANGQDMLCGGC